jgi:hypothetical protein
MLFQALRSYPILIPEELFVKRRRGHRVVAAQVLFALRFVRLSLPVAQATQSPAVKQGLPDNPMHPAPPVQPIPYSHKTHLALGLQCQFCHSNPDPGNLMSFPAASKCMGCHATIANDKPAIRKLADFAKTHHPGPWVRA